MAKDKWRPLERRYMAPATPDDSVVKLLVKNDGMTVDAAMKLMDEYHADRTYYVNDLYQVEVERADDDKMVRLNIRRRDGGVIARDWRHFQQIKNELVGPECEGFELYPAESRKVDTCNKYHLWVMTDPTARIGVGWCKRDVNYDEGDTRGMRQRRLEPRLQGILDH